jgi:excisionase family DNA binding protein
VSKSEILGWEVQMVDRRLIDINELSELTGLSKNTIYCWVSQRRIPFVKCGRLTKFDLQKIEKWIEENSVEETKFEHITDKKSY